MAVHEYCTCEASNPARPSGALSDWCLNCHKRIVEEIRIGAKMPDDKKFAERLIKHHQRIIHEIRERYGLTE